MIAVSKKIKNMEEFARVSGISRPTVSKYFNEPESVRPSTRARIEEALARYDYRPNVYAMNQNRRLTKNVGIIVPYLADPFFAEIARNIEDACIARGYTPMLHSSHGDPAMEVEILESLRSLKPAGVLLAPIGRRSDRKAVAAFAKHVPTMLFDSNLEGIGAGFVGSDNFQSVPMIVDYLCRTGEAPCFMEMPPVNPNANKRRMAYVGAMERLGKEPQVISLPGDGWNFEEVGFREGRRILGDGGFPSSTILCSNDRLAIGLLAAAYEAGIKVGHGAGCSMRIAGHDDHPFARYTCPALTTVSQDYDSISQRSVDSLFALVEGGGKATSRPEILFEGRLVMRDSA